MADETVSLILNIKNDAEKEFDKLNKELKELKKNLGQTDSATDDLDGGLGNVGNTASSTASKIKLVSTGFAAVAGIMAAVVAKTVEQNQELERQANFAGVSIEKMQELGYAASQTGSNIQEMSDALNEISLKSTEAAALNTGAFVDIAKLAGLTIQEFASLSPDEQLLKFADATKVADKNLKNLLNDELGSDTFINLNKLTSQGSEAIKKYGEEAKKAGIITKEENDKVLSIGKSFASLQQTLTTLATKKVAEFSEEIVYLIKKVQDLISEFSTGKFARPISASLAVITKSVKAVSAIIVGIAKAIGSTFDLAIEGLKTGVDSVIISVDKLSKKFTGKSFIDEETVERSFNNIEISAAKSKNAVEDFKNSFNDVPDAFSEIGEEINKYAKLSAAQQTALERGLNGLLETQEQYNTAIRYATEIYGETSKEVEDLKGYIVELREEAKKGLVINASLDNVALQDAIKEGKKIIQSFGKSEEERINIQFKIDQKKQNDAIKSTVTNLGKSINDILAGEIKFGESINFKPDFEIDKLNIKENSDAGVTAALTEYFNNLVGDATKEFNLNGLSDVFIDKMKEINSSLNNIDFKIIKDEEINKVSFLTSNLDNLKAVSDQLEIDKKIKLLNNEISLLDTTKMSDLVKQIDLTEQKLELMKIQGKENTNEYQILNKELTSFKDNISNINFDNLKELFELSAVTETDLFAGYENELNRLIEKFGAASLEVLKFKDEINDLKIELQEEEIAKIDELIDLGILTDEDKLEALNKLKDLLPETSLAFLEVQNEIRELSEEMDIFGQATELFAEDFSSGLVEAMKSAESFGDALSSVLSDIVQQMAEAAIQALIFSAIMSAFGGNGQTFGQNFSTNFQSNIGVGSATTRHNTGEIGATGDSGNSTKSFNLALPNNGLNPDERLIIGKTNESVVKTDSLNNKNNNVNDSATSPQVNIDNRFSADALNDSLNSSSTVDTLVNIMNNNYDKIIKR